MGILRGAENDYALLTSRALMLEIQVDELQSMLNEAQMQKKNACYRASRYEQKNKRLQNQILRMEDDFQIIAQCWKCANWGNKAICCTCSNSSVFEKICEEGGGMFEASNNGR